MSQDGASATYSLLLPQGDAELAVPLAGHQVHVVGSHWSCDVTLAHASVAPRHAELAVDAGGVTLRPLAPDASIRVDGDPLSGPRRLLGIESLRFGDVELRLRCSGDGVRSASAAAAPTVSPEALAAGEVPPPLKAEPGFHDLLAEELRKAPWVALSLSCHALIALLAWLALDQLRGVEPEEPPRLVFAPAELERPIDGLDDGPVAEEAREEVPAARVEEAPDVEAPREEPPLEPEVESAAAWEVDAFGPTGFGGLGADPLGRRSAGGDDQGIERIIGRGELRRTVSAMRQRGLEVAIVFDSTGSMGSVIQQVKRKVDDMVATFQALVPTTRVALVTYRDHGREEYLTRECPLTHSRYRLQEFVEGVRASGGDDIPEAVADALAVAFRKLDWTRDSYRAVILIGDAPPHRETYGRVQRLVRDFRHGADVATVSAIFTGLPVGTEASEAEKVFQQIARTGGGIYAPITSHDRIVMEIIGMVFGKQHVPSLQDLYAAVERSNRPGARERSWIQDLDVASMLQQGLLPRRDRRIHPEVVEALVRMGTSPVKRREVIEGVLTLLAREDLAEETLWAGRHILARVTNGEASFDPEVSTTQRRRQLARIREIALP